LKAPIVVLPSGKTLSKFSAKKSPAGDTMLFRLRNLLSRVVAKRSAALMLFYGKLKKNIYFLPSLILVILIASALFFLWAEIYLPINSFSTQSQVFEVAIDRKSVV
jgi:hypothetical protein